MKRLIHSLLSGLVLAGLLVGFSFSPSQAKELNQASAAQTTLSFDQIGQADTVMRGPYSTTRLRFGLPANWAFENGVALHLFITSSLITDKDNSVSDGQYIAATLRVTLNKKIITTIPLVAGTNVAYEVPIPVDAFVTTLNDGRQDLSLFLDASVDCNNVYHSTTVIVSSASYFSLPYHEVKSQIGLNILPRPIYQRDSVFPVDAVMVVPDSPSVDEMKAALIVSASFGRMSVGLQSLILVSASQLTQELQGSSNLIFVGKASSLPILQRLTLPASLVNNNFSLAGMQADDGLLQMAISPWNDGRVSLVVSGNSDAGVVKAAQALSAGEIQTGADPNLAIVAEVTSPSYDSSPGQNTLGLIPQDTHTFGELGYETMTISGEGRGSVNIEFYIPPGFVAGEDSYVDLIFNNSALIDFNQSGLAVFLNGQMVGSSRLSEETAATVTQRIKIPTISMLPGNNVLTIEADLAPISVCSSIASSNISLSVFSDSLLHLPLKMATAGDSALRDLSFYPYPFINIPTLANTAFVLSRTNPNSWMVAAQIAAGLGQSSNGSLYDLKVVFDGDVPNDIRMNNDLIVVDLPQDSKLITELDKSLPAPFEAGTNVATLKNQQIVYRFSPEINLGYLELLPAPWNASRSILVVTGNTEAGVRLGGTALFDTTLRSRLRGNLALIKSDQIVVADTRTGLGLGEVTSESTNQAIEPESTPLPLPSTSSFTPFSPKRPAWILIVVGVLVALIAIVLIIAALSSRNSDSKG
jgi:hypothetical protein